jgi:hypothetical protein
MLQHSKGLLTKRGCQPCSDGHPRTRLWAPSFICRLSVLVTGTELDCTYIRSVDWVCVACAYSDT